MKLRNRCRETRRLALILCSQTMLEINLNLMMKWRKILPLRAFKCICVQNILCRRRIRCIQRSDSDERKITSIDEELWVT